MYMFTVYATALNCFLEGPGVVLPSASVSQVFPLVASWILPLDHPTLLIRWQVWQTTSISSISGHDLCRAGLLAIGGIAGFVKGKSVPSLVAGVSLGGLYGAAGVLINRGDCKEGHALAAVTSALVVGVMGPRFVRSKKVMPAGLLTAAASGSFVYDAYKAQQWHAAE